MAIVGGGDFCTLISRRDDAQLNPEVMDEENISKELINNQHILILCNSIGTPIESKYVEIEPEFWAMSATHVVVASKSHFYIWNYYTMFDRFANKKQSNEKYFIFLQFEDSF